MKKYILGVETSCDDTGIGLLEIDNNEMNILYNKRISFDFYNTKFGGVVPEIMARNHLEAIDKLVAEVKKIVPLNQIDVIAATAGPGLIGSLSVGFSFAKYLAITNKVTFIPVHHLEAHIDVVNPSYPALIILISGGHSMIIYAKSLREYHIICNTRDDSFGELIDKVGRELGLQIPSGRQMEEIASTCDQVINPQDIKIVLKDKLEFSCSGLKTHFIKMIRSQKFSKLYMAKLLQETIIQNIKYKIDMATELTNCNNYIICGGVSANSRLREVMHTAKFPSVELSTDNGVMVAYAAKKHLDINSKMINNIEIEEFSSMSLSKWILSL